MSEADPLARIRVVLSHPSHPGNIGAVARAMKTMGVTRLHLVNPRGFPDAQASARARFGADVLERAMLCASVREALHGSVLAAGLTARQRDSVAPMRWAREAAQELVATARSGEVALVFGNETYGLSNEELGLCQIPVMIPADPQCNSLNLAAAVQVMCYELRMAAMANGEAPRGAAEPATFEEVEQLLAHLHGAVLSSGFLDPDNPKRLMPRIRRLFARARLEKEEVSILRGMLRSFEKQVD